MKQKFLLFMTLWLVLLATVSAQTAITPSLGDGSESSPYEIATVDNLYWLSQNSDYWDKFYIQTADIDVSTISNFTPIGNYNIKFTGSYNGQGYSISNLTITGSNRTAMFGYTSGSSLQSINLENATVSGEKYTAILAACALNTDITACTSSGSVTSSGNSFTGGLVANFYGGGAIINCSNSASVIASDQYVGGIACLVNDNSQISGCYNTGAITTESSVTADAGGVIGAVESSSSSAVITNCYNTGNVNAESGNSAGGVIGTCKGATVINCYSTGTVIAATQAGGIAGYCGYYTNTFTGSYCMQTPAIGEAAILTASETDIVTISEAEMQTQTTFTDFDFAGITSDGSNDLWAMVSDMNSGYPVFKWQVEAEGVLLGSGTESDPYLICSLADLRILSENTDYWTSSYYFKQTADIDASSTKSWNGGEGFSPIGDISGSSNPDRQGIAFYGFYNGAGHVIDGLYINRTDENNVGLFGYSGVDIDSLGLINCTVNGYSFVGGLVGRLYYHYYNENSIKNCYVTGSVSGKTYDTGGLVGGDQAPIRNCYVTADVTGSLNIVGGIVGSTSSTRAIISNCYATGRVTCDGTNVGAFIGSTGNTFSNCYYNSETSESTDYYAEGLTTTEMQELTNFTEWDFAGLTSDGTDDVWTIVTGINDGYPVLMWQIDNASESVLSEVKATLADDEVTVTLESSFTALGTPNPVAYGFCYSLSEKNPTIENSTTIDYESVNGNETIIDFSGVITINKDAILYVRSYAINAAGTAYSNNTSVISPFQPQSITFDALATQTYGDTDIKLNASASSGLPVSYSLSDIKVATILDETIHIIGSGTCTIYANQEGNDTYDVAEQVSQVLTVNKATLTVTADNQNVAQGSVMPELTINYSGFVNEEDENILTSLPTASTIATTNSPIGMYDINISGGQANNYEFNYVSGTFTVTVSTAIDDVEVGNLKVYPNPASSIIYVDESKGMVNIYNVSGSKMVTHDLSNGNSIDISAFEKGVYLLRVEGQVFKFIKE